MKKVSVIILNYNGGRDTLLCIESLRTTNYLNYEVIVVDNASTDSSIQTIRDRFPDIMILENKSNLGFAEGMNVGIRKVRSLESKVKSDYVLLLNQDIIVDRNFLNELVKVSESDTKIGIVGPKIYYYQSSKSNQDTNIIWSYGTRWATGSVFKMKVPYIGPIAIGCGEIDRGQYDKIKEVESITGCCMLIKSEVIDKVGLLDSNFFMIHEDDDYCIRARKAGYKVCIASESIIWHKVSTSLIGKKDKMITGRDYEANPIAIYYGHRNWLFVLRKHFGLKIYSKVFFTYIIKVLPLSFISLIKRRNLSIKIALAHLYPIFDSLMQRTYRRF